MAKTFSVIYAQQPHRNVSFKVRGVCEYDVLNPCWDNRPTDVRGQHWGGGASCKKCAAVAAEDQAAEDAAFFDAMPGAAQVPA